MEPLAVVEEPPIDPLDQDRRMNRVLVPMQCLMYGNASRFDQNKGRQKPSGGDCPPGEAHPLHTVWQQKYVLAAPEDREQVIADATDALVRYRCGPRPEGDGESQEDREARVIKEGRGWSPREVAVAFNTGATEIISIRRRYGCDPSNGSELKGELSARELAERGMTACQIAGVLGCSKQYAQYYVTRARKQAA